MKIKKKGMAIIWALLIISILAIVSTTIATFVIKDAHSAIDIQSSTQAYASAKTGSEWGAIYAIETMPSTETSHANRFLISDYTVSVSIEKVTGGHKIISEASGKGLKRKIEYNLNRVDEDRFANDTRVGTLAENLTGTSIVTSGSFDFNFSLLIKTNPIPASPILYGFKNTAGDQIGVLLATGSPDPTITVYYKPYGAPIQKGSLIPVNIGNKYRVNLKYLNNTNLTLELEGRDISGELSCEKMTSINLSGLSIGYFNKYFYSTEGHVVVSEDTDSSGALALQVSSSNIIYIDNIRTAGINWVLSPNGQFYVYKSDLNNGWTISPLPSPVNCSGPQCKSGLDANHLSLPSLVKQPVDFSNYPARQECGKLGGRLPYANELLHMLSNDSYFDAFNAGFLTAVRYWTATQHSSDFNNAFVMTLSVTDTVSESMYQKNFSTYYRCVKDK